MFLKKLGITVYELHKGACELKKASLDQASDRLSRKIDSAKQTALENPDDATLETISALLKNAEYSKKIVDIAELAIGLFMADILGVINKSGWAANCPTTTGC